MSSHDVEQCWQFFSTAAGNHGSQLLVFRSTGSSDAPSNSSEAEDIDLFVVTTPVETPCVLRIARRDAFLGADQPQPTFFAEAILQANAQAHIQAPRFVHKVKSTCKH